MIILLMGLAIILLTMVLLGWLTFAKSDSEAAIRIRTWKIKRDTQIAVDKTRTFLVRGRRVFRERRLRTRQSQRPSIEDADQATSFARGETRRVHGN